MLYLVIFCCKNVLPQMLEQGSGYLMNTSSAAGLLTQVGLAPYSVTKAAALSLAEWIKITYGNKGIRFLASPQAVKTPMTENSAGTAGVDGMIEPEECAAAVLEAIEKEQFLITPHEEVLEYIKEKLQTMIDGLEACKDFKVNLKIFMVIFSKKLNHFK